MRQVFMLMFALPLLLASPVQAGHHESGEAVSKGSAPGKSAGAAETSAQADPNGRKQAPAGSAMPSKPMTEYLKRPRAAIYRAPETFKVRFETTKGDFVVQITRAWSPTGADRFYNLTRFGFWDDIAFFRVIDGFMAQFGMHGDPKVTRHWQKATITDDPVVKSNLRGYVTFAKTSLPHSRTTQLFINFGDNPNLDEMDFAPFGQVIEGMDVVDQIYKVGEGPPAGPGPSPRRIQLLGNDYLRKNYPQIDYIKRGWFTE